MLKLFVPNFLGIKKPAELSCTCGSIISKKNQQVNSSKKRIYDATSLQSNDSPGMICNRSRPRRSKSRMVSLAFRCSSGLQLSMRCKMSMPEGFSCLILRYSVSPSTALYIEAKSMTGTVRVPSMSKTTPLKRVLVLVDMAVM